jgi:hypothetical protein
MNTPPHDDDDRWLEAHLPPVRGPADPLVRRTVATALERARWRNAQRGAWMWGLAGMALATAVMLVVNPIRPDVTAPAEPLQTAAWDSEEDDQEDAALLETGLLDALSADELAELEDDLEETP